MGTTTQLPLIRPLLFDASTQIVNDTVKHQLGAIGFIAKKHFEHLDPYHAWNVQRGLKEHLYSLSTSRAEAFLTDYFQNKAEIIPKQREIPWGIIQGPLSEQNADAVIFERFHAVMEAGVRFQHLSLLVSEELLEETQEKTLLTYFDLTMPLSFIPIINDVSTTIQTINPQEDYTLITDWSIASCLHLHSEKYQGPLIYPLKDWTLALKIQSDKEATQDSIIQFTEENLCELAQRLCPAYSLATHF